MTARTTICLVAISLCGCAGGAARPGDAFARPAERAECQVASGQERAPPGQIASLDYQRCHPDNHLQWSSERSDTIQPDFSGARDE